MFEMRNLSDEEPEPDAIILRIFQELLLLRGNGVDEIVNLDDEDTSLWVGNGQY